MTIKTEITLHNFEFWGGAQENVKLLTTPELNTVEYMLTDCYGEDLTATQLNDLFWFDFNIICEWLDLDPDAVEARRE